MRGRILSTLCLALSVCANTPEATSLLGAPLRPPALDLDVRREREAHLRAAEAAHRKDPADPDIVIWVGRRTAYLGRYREAVAVYSEGIARHPGHAKLYRHRGHRHITLRRLADAVRDLEEAARLIEGVPDEVEPDGLPNARNTPTSTSHSNIWYHLGLAYYLSGDFANALRCYRECLGFSKNPDMLCATSHWLYMTLRRLGRDREAGEALAPIRRDLDVIENHGYHRLLLFYKGELSERELLEEARGGGDLDFATVAYGVANWNLCEGRKQPARALFEEIVAGEQWPAFGHIAAEAELARGRR